jgi:hypothetical protein
VYSGLDCTFVVSKFRFVFWVVLPCKIIVDRRFRGTCCLHHQGNHHQLFYMAVQPRRQIWTSYSPPRELEISLCSIDPDVADFRPLVNGKGNPFKDISILRNRRKTHDIIFMEWWWLDTEIHLWNNNDGCEYLALILITILAVMYWNLNCLFPGFLLQCHLREGYGKLIQCYTVLLITKLDFHRRNPRFPGNLQVTKEELENIGENDINN